MDFEFFKKNEFTCKCGCGSNLAPDYLLAICDAVRRKMGCAIYVTSGTRCVSHNRFVGGVDNSYHVKGIACDLVPENGNVEQLAGYLRAYAPISGIIIYHAQGFVHFDLRPYTYFEEREAS